MANTSKRRGMSPILAFILGFLFALIIIVGAVAGVVFYALNFKLDNLEFNKDEENNYIYVNADPNGDTANLLQLVNKVVSMTKDTSTLTIEQIEAIFPIANKLTDAVNGALGAYVEIDMERLKKTVFPELGAFLQDTVLEIQPAAVLDSFGGELNNIQLLKKVLYDKDNNPVTLRAFTDGSALDNLYETEVIELFDGNEDEYDDLTFTVLEGTKVGDLVNGGLDFKDKVNGLPLSKFVTVFLTEEKLTTDKTILLYVVYGLTDIKAIGGDGYSYTAMFNPVDGGDKIPCFVQVEESGKITKVFQNEEEEVKGTLVSEISKRTQRLTNDLTVGQIMDVSGNDFLKMLENSTIANLGDDISNLTINELYADNIYCAIANEDSGAKPVKYLAVEETPQKAEYNENYIYYVLKDGNYELASTTGKLTAEEYGNGDYVTCGAGKILFSPAYVYFDGADGELVGKGGENAGKVTEFAENKYYTYGAANAMWKLLLYKDGSEMTVTVNGFNDMITNVSNNIEDATIYELDESGVIDMSANKDNIIKVHGDPRKPENDPYGKRIGELTLKELLDFFSYIVSFTTSDPSIPVLPTVPSN